MTSKDSLATVLSPADPKPLGFGVFGITLGIYALVFLRVIPDTGGATDGLFTLLTVALFVAGIISFLRDESWHGTFFLYWSFHAWRIWEEGGTAWSERSNRALLHGWFILGVAVFNLVLFWGGVRRADVDVLSSLVVLGAAVASLSVALVNWGIVFLGPVGGGAGLVASLLALSVAARTLRAGSNASDLS